MERGKEQPRLSIRPSQPQWIGKKLRKGWAVLDKNLYSFHYSTQTPSLGSLFWWHPPLTSYLQTLLLASRILVPWTLLSLNGFYDLGISHCLGWESPHFSQQPLSPTPDCPNPSQVNHIPLLQSPAGVGILNRKEQLEPSKPITLELKIPSLLLEPPYFVPAPVCSFSDCVIKLGKPMQIGMGIL